jgi:hypothetical protein
MLDRMNDKKRHTASAKKAKILAQTVDGVMSPNPVVVKVAMVKYKLS